VCVWCGERAAFSFWLLAKGKLRHRQPQQILVSHKNKRQTITSPGQNRLGGTPVGAIPVDRARRRLQRPRRGKWRASTLPKTVHGLCFYRRPAKSPALACPSNQATKQPSEPASRRSLTLSLSLSRHRTSLYLRALLCTAMCRRACSCTCQRDSAAGTQPLAVCCVRGQNPGPERNDTGKRMFCFCACNMRPPFSPPSVLCSEHFRFINLLQQQKAYIPWDWT
jgi:hypothetical protein